MQNVTGKLVQGIQYHKLATNLSRHFFAVQGEGSSLKFFHGEEPKDQCPWVMNPRDDDGGDGGGGAAGIIINSIKQLHLRDPLGCVVCPGEIHFGAEQCVVIWESKTAISVS